MSKLFYFLATFAESGLSVFGIRATYDQPSYRVVRSLAPDVELRAYAPRAVVETAIGPGGDGEAFGRLFSYITGANHGAQTIAMTVPVEQRPREIGMALPVSMEAGQAMMSFYLPPAIVASGPPQPSDSRLDIRTIPAVTLAVIRYSGLPTASARTTQTGRLRDVLKQAGLRSEDAPQYLYYDPPFTIPFLRRNEVALPIAP